jgi:hypothetical protein
MARRWLQARRAEGRPMIFPDDYVTADQLDLTPEEVRRLCPHAVEYVALDGQPCWARPDLDGLSGGESAHDDGRE